MSLFGNRRRLSLHLAARSLGWTPRGRQLLAVTMVISASGFAGVPATASPRPAIAAGEVTAWGYNQEGETTVPEGLTQATAISGGYMSALALKSDGTVVGWGDNRQGQVTVPAGLMGVTAIAAGENHSLALKSDGTVVAWGENNSGQSTVPAGLTDVTAIAAGSYFSLALKNDGTLTAWGDGIAGESMVPNGLSDVIAISAGYFHSLALKRDGTVVAWGYNSGGQSTVPVGLTGVTAIAGGGEYSLALKGDGTVVGWGDNSGGQSTVPVGLTGVTAIAAGYEHSDALTSDGKVVVWGRSSEGERSVPSELTGVFAISAGGYYSMVLRVVATPPVFTADSPTTTVQAGVPVDYTFAASGTPAPTFAVSAGSLPAGLSLSEDGVLSGTSTVAGSSDFTITASNGHVPEAISAPHTIEVTPGPVDVVSVAPQAAGSTTYTATAGDALPFSATGADQWGNPLTGQTATFTTDRTVGMNPDAVSGSSVTLYTAGVHLVTTTIGGVSTTVSVTTLPGAPVSTELASSSLQVPLGGSINLSMSGLDAYGNVIDLTDQAVFTSDWAVDVISGSTITFPHASPHVITGRVGSLTSTTTIEVVEPTVAASTAAAGSLSALAFTGISPLPAVFGGAGALLVGLLVSLFTWSRRRIRARIETSTR